MSDEEEEEFFNKNTHLPVYKEDREQHKTHNKQVLLNLGIFALLTAISSLIFMIWLAKKTREDERIKPNILPFHNPLDRSQLLCPLNTSFDTSRFSCVECPENCEYCYHEYTQRCVQCVHPYKLFENECVEDCISVDNVCINTLDLAELNYTIVDLGTELRVNQLFQVEIHTYSSENIIIIFPPMGQSFNYFYDSLKLPELAKIHNATIFVFSTPYTEVLQIQSIQDDENQTQSEEFRFIERIGNYTKNYFTEQTKSIKIVGLGDMLFFAHELATMIVKQNTCSDGQITVVLLQTKKIQLFEFLNLNDLRLQHLLAYIDSEWDITHKENTTDLIANDKPDLTTQLRDFRSALNFNKQIRPSYNKKIDVIVVSESGSRDIQPLYSDGFGAKSFKQIQLDTDKWSVLFGKAL